MWSELNSLVSRSLPLFFFLGGGVVVFLVSDVVLVVARLC